MTSVGPSSPALAPGRWTIAPFLGSAFAAVLIMGLSGLMTEVGPWSQSLRMPAWRPPDWAFPLVWAAIFSLWAVAVAIAWRAAPDRSARDWLAASLVLNGVLNVAWSALFFRLRHPDWALWEVGALWLSILLVMLALWRCSRLAALLLVPYLFWVSAAARLTWEIVGLNAPF